MDIFSYPFMIRAFAAGIMIGFLGGFYGPLIVQRKMSFLGTGLAHAAFGGVALGLLLKVDPLYTAIPFTVAVSVFITFLSEKTRLSHDTLIGVLFSLAVALGIIFISLIDTYTSDAFTYLFGSILSVFEKDLIAIGILCIITLAAGKILWGKWAYAGFDFELAATDNIKTRANEYLLLLLTSLTIVTSIKLVGIILMAAYLVIPAAAARLVSESFGEMTVKAVIIGIISSLAGLVAAYYLNLPAGASIIIIQSAIFGAAFFIKKV
ncbi:MAG: metal ABC transporter permease [Bacteroidota bacterium]